MLKILCSEAARKKFKEDTPNVDISVISAYETVELGEYRITALPARHMNPGEALIYIIEGEKTLLYAHDTGYPYEEVFEYIEKRGIKFDMVTLDCTYGDVPTGDDIGHMAFENVGRVVKRLKAMGAISDSTPAYINHFSHNGTPLHRVLEESAAKIGCAASYDGCEIVF